MFKRFHGSEIADTGIGLAICRNIAEAHHGFLEANSEEVIGATFSVYFPVHQAPFAAAAG
jgi:signal transduction histidine kinase